MPIECTCVGCTGTFIVIDNVIDNVLEQIEKEQVVDIPGAITKIRQRRMKIVQTHMRPQVKNQALLQYHSCMTIYVGAIHIHP